ncbi:probable serine/threonine-protein kinase WNK5 isoform X1 [Zingiber officinale]|uniref:probable serine/threonine-protein kinase WNK5 isoform X1 n=1 Tax=Zingiber officinale TaxID=94328 RepID=UPI001C4D8B02|nr:probable serine/threonine-protein kinase WNK5 isoform X1 [Zingiber officinale]
MLEARRWERERRSPERSLTAGNGYVEVDPSGRYGRFDEVLGKGATKTVYKAFDELNGTEVAWNQAKLCIVMQSPEALQRMYSEVHLLSSLSHESIIRFHASWVDIQHRTLNFITEMFTSGTLREYRQTYPRVDIRAIKSWARQILHGLVYLHGHDPPVIHRDIKCDNIFVNGHLGQVKIGDLGLAAVLRRHQSAHSVIGTPEFMAPELYEEEYNELVDIYSYGMCMVEMLTAECPYSECCNPAQIYKKVTSGKLPEAFYRIQDPEAKRFISRCLENVANRSSAKELLLDPFLALDDHHGPPLTLKNTPAHVADQDSILHDHKKNLNSSDQVDDIVDCTIKRTDMSITGKMNPEGDTIFLKVQIADKEGHVRNIYFPFDVVSDTPMNVANEMVKELEITDREPLEIADMIAQEISILVPDWKESASGGNDLHHAYNYVDDAEDGCNHPFYNIASPTSSQGSVFGTGQREGWFQGGLFSDDDDMSSTHSGKYSCMNYTSSNEQESEMSFHQSNHEAKEDAALTRELEKKCSVGQPESSSSRTSCAPKGSTADSRRLTRNCSMVDMRSQLLHRNLVEHLKKRLFKTVGAVEQIGFQNPLNGSRKATSSSRGGGGEYRKQKPGFTWARS